LRSYSKKPPKRGEALAEIFELTFELIDFHGISASGASAPECAARRRMLSPPLGI
jgi:hypothetical protein